MSIYSSVGKLPAIPDRDNYTGEPSTRHLTGPWAGFIDVATATSHHDCIRLTVQDSDEGTLLLDAVEAEALIAALTEAVLLVRKGRT